MNTLTEHDRKLAETLKSLSLETPEPPRTHVGWVAGALFLAAAGIAAALLAPGFPNDLIAGLSDNGDVAKLDQTGSGKALRSTPEHDNISPSMASPATSAREITGSGYVIALHSTTVFSKYEGQITDIAVDVGDRVHAGQVLAVLEDASARLALEQANAAKVSADLALAAREITLAHAKALLRRSEALTRLNATARKDLEDTETGLKQALNGVELAHQEAARADLAIRVARERVDGLTVRAPFAGTVTQLSAHIGDTVLARADSVRESQSLLTLTDTTDLAIDADMAETNLSLLRPGLRGEAMLDGFPDQPFAIELQRIAPIASAEKGTIGLRLSLVEPPVGIRPNMAARIRIIVPETHYQTGEAQR